MAHTSGDQTKDGSQQAKDAPNQVNPAATTASTTATTTSTATVHDPDQDKDFDPTAEALIDEIDDERTLEEEEALANADSTAVQNEIDDLKRESEMPIEELLAYYERMRNEEAAAAEANEEEDEEFEEEEEDEDEDDYQDDDEESDEVRKKRRADKSVSDTNTVYNGQRLAPAVEQPIGRSASQQMQSTLSEQAQPHHLSNSPILSPQQNRSSDVNLSNNPEQQSDEVELSGRQTQVQCQDSAYLGSDNTTTTTTTTPVSMPPTSEDNLTNSHLDSHHKQRNCTYPHHEPWQPVDVTNTLSSTTPRAHRHSMTEFLVDSDTAAGGIFKSLLDYDLDDSDDMDEDYSYTDDENEEDEREWRRVIHIGPDHQADVPEGLSEYETDLPPYETQDTLVWRCNPEQESEQLLNYLKQASMIGKRTDISLSPASVPKISDSNLRLYRERMQDSSSVVITSLNSMERNHEKFNTGSGKPPPENLQQDVYMSQSRKRLRIDNELEQENALDGLVQPSGDLPIVNNLVTIAKDENSSSISQDNRPELSTEDYFQGEEQLLYLLLQCNHNLDESLRRRRLDPLKYYLSEPMSLWSQEECLGFEHGLRTYGKNFRLIRDTKVPTRTRAEVVAFYYLWKKSERHDVYTNEYKLDRKRCLTHPGTTDYMDKFIEDNESALNASSTPTPTPIDSPAELHHISHIPNIVGNQPISICNTSAGVGTPQLDCLRSPQESSMNQTYNELNHQTRNDDNTPQSNPLYLDSNTPI